MVNYSHQAQYDFSRMLADFVDRYGRVSEMEEAIIFAQAVELQLLKAPQTAVFPPMEQFRVVRNGWNYTVSGFVDSQNSYGANVRTPFTMNVNKNGGVWNCVDKFVSTASQVQASVIGNTILWWILGIVGSLITYFVISNAIGL